MNKIAEYIQEYDPVLHVPIYLMLFHTTWTYVVGELTGNCSQVDRIWTFLPPMYSCLYALMPLLPFAPKEIQEAGLNHRVILMAVLQLIWMTRLSYNTWRRGLFTLSEEDYRWQILRDNMPAPVFHVFHLMFIAAMQNGILYGLGYPAYLALRNPNTSLGPIDAGLTVLALGDLLIEFTADNQQYSFQTFKHSKQPRVQKPPSEEWIFAKQRWTEHDVKTGFVTKGLWAWSRHPNFAAEQMFWWLMVAFPLFTTPGSLDLPHIDVLFSKSTYTSIAAFRDVYSSLEPIWPGIVISMLFLGSTAFTEWITKRKYKTYAAYQDRVGMFSPTGTILKAWYLQATGQKEAVEALIWGSKAESQNGFKAE